MTCEDGDMIAVIKKLAGKYVRWFFPVLSDVLDLVCNFLSSRICKSFLSLIML